MLNIKSSSLSISRHLRGNLRGRACSPGGSIPHSPVSLWASVCQPCKILVSRENEGVLHQPGSDRRPPFGQPCRGQSEHFWSQGPAFVQRDHEQPEGGGLRMVHVWRGDRRNVVSRCCHSHSHQGHSRWVTGWFSTGKRSKDKHLHASQMIPLLQVCQWWAVRWAGKKGAVSQWNASTVRDTGIWFSHSPYYSYVSLYPPSDHAEPSFIETSVYRAAAPRKTRLFVSRFTTRAKTLTDSQPSLTPLWLPVNRESEKKWCRSGNSSACLLTGSEGSYEDTSVAISDDRTRTFTITLKKLQLRDSGWYWCYAGQQRIAVSLVVTPRPTTSRLPLPLPENWYYNVFRLCIQWGSRQSYSSSHSFINVSLKAALTRFGNTACEDAL